MKVPDPCRTGAAKRVLVPTPATKTYTPYFSPTDDKSTLLNKIDTIWRTGYLFTEINDPESDFYTHYINELTLIAQRLYPVSDFDDECVYLGEKEDLTPQVRAICLTQALELKLLGENPEPVLIQINKCSYGHTRGYRNELVASWFLAKFVYRLNPSESNRFVHSEEFPTYNRGKKKKGNSMWEREVDIHVKGHALVSVKCAENSFPEQIRDLFFVVTDGMFIGGRGENLINEIQKIILIKTAEREKEEQFSPEYRQDRRYQGLKGEAIALGKKCIQEFTFPSKRKDEFVRCYRNLISDHGIDIYFLPSIDSVKDLKEWIEKNYTWMDVPN